MAPLKNTASRTKALDFSHLLTTGAVAGLAVGFPFILFGLLLVPFFLTTMSRSAR